MRKKKINNMKLSSDQIFSTLLEKYNCFRVVYTNGKWGIIAEPMGNYNIGEWGCSLNEAYTKFNALGEVKCITK